MRTDTIGNLEMGWGIVNLRHVVFNTGTANEAKQFSVDPLFNCQGAELINPRRQPAQLFNEMQRACVKTSMPE